MSEAVVSLGVILLEQASEQVPSQVQSPAVQEPETAPIQVTGQIQVAHSHAEVQAAQIEAAEIEAAQIEAAQIEAALVNAAQAAQAAQDRAANRTLEQALSKAAALVMALSPEEIADLAAGRGRLVYQPVQAAAQGELAGRLAEHLERREPAAETPSEARTDPRAHRAARREPARRALGIDIASVVERINACTSSVEVAAYLDGLDARFTVPVLREIARAIGPTVNATGRTKGQLQRDIVEGTAGFRERTAAMSGGAWG